MVVFISLVISVVKAKRQVNRTMVKQVVEIGGEAGVMVVLSIEKQTFALSAARINQCV